MTEILYCQSPRPVSAGGGAADLLPPAAAGPPVRAALDLVLCILLLIGGVVLYYLGIYSDCFTIHDFWQIRTSGWVGLGVVAAGSVWHLCKVCKRGVERRRTERAARQTEEAHRQALESAAGRRMKPERPTPPGASAVPPPPRRHPPFPSPQRTPRQPDRYHLPGAYNRSLPLTHRSPLPEEQVKPCKNPDTKPMTLWLQCLPNTVQPR